ncbi:Paxillin, partial [Eschrichtius robustus]|nr:Paxillin [Eschrichtius robustus]
FMAQGKTGSSSPPGGPPKPGSQLDSMLGSLQSDLNKLGVATVAKGVCGACKKPIAGQVVTAMGKTWHPEHFVCTHCQEEIGSRNFFERDGQPYCEKDYHNLFSPRCYYCNGPILDKVVTALDRTWHPEHFFCAQCGAFFGPEGFHEKDGKAYCRKDYFDMFAPKCGGCARAILENYISALNTLWHPECFVCRQLLDDYPKCFIVGADNVGSKQMQQIRMSLRGKAVVLMGKNTMMRKAIRGHLENNPALEKLLPHIRGNVGFVFTKEDLTEIRDMLLANKERLTRGCLGRTCALVGRWLQGGLAALQTLRDPRLPRGRSEKGPGEEALIVPGAHPGTQSSFPPRSPGCRGRHPARGRQAPGPNGIPASLCGVGPRCDPEALRKRFRSQRRQDGGGHAGDAVVVTWMVVES